MRGPWLWAMPKYTLHGLDIIAAVVLVLVVQRMACLLFLVYVTESMVQSGVGRYLTNEKITRHDKILCTFVNRH